MCLMIQSRLFLLRDDVFIHLELLHAAWKVIYKNPKYGHFNVNLYTIILC